MAIRKSSMMLDGPSRTRSALLLLIESGAFVFTTKLIEFILFKLAPPDGINGLNALYVVFEVIPQVLGLMPTLIVFTVNARVTITDYITARSSIAPSGTYTGGPLVFGQGGVTTTIGGSTTFHLPPSKTNLAPADYELKAAHSKGSSNV
jgi:hypothetical protein